jgi:PAS domain-containing protein
METLLKTGQRLEELTAGQVDTVVDRDGRTFLLRGTQEQLRQSENARQAAVLNALPAHIALLDTKGIIISVNDAWRRPSPARILLTVTPLAYGHQNGAVVMHLDITSRRHAESTHQMLTERLSLATAVAKVGVWEWELASNSLTWDFTMFEIYGLAPIVPMPYEKWSSAVHPEDLPHVEATLRRVIDQKCQGSAEFRIITATGAVRNISAVEGSDPRWARECQSSHRCQHGRHGSKGGGGNPLCREGTSPSNPQLHRRRRYLFGHLREYHFPSISSPKK